MKKMLLIVFALLLIAGCVWTRYPRRMEIEGRDDDGHRMEDSHDSRGNGPSGQPDGERRSGDED